MTNELKPPGPVYSPFTVRDKWIARVVDTSPLETPSPYTGCRTPADTLARYLELAGPGKEFIFNRI